MSSISEYVEGLGLDVGIVERHPLQVLLGQFRVSRLARLLAHGLDGVGAVLGLLCAGNGGEAGTQSTHVHGLSKHARHARVARARGRRHSRRLGPAKHFASGSPHYPKKDLREQRRSGGADWGRQKNSCKALFNRSEISW